MSHRDGVQKRLGYHAVRRRNLRNPDVPHHVEVVSAHRTPDKLFSFAESAEENGYQVIIAGAGGAAHLPGMIAAKNAGAGAGRASTERRTERCR